MSKRKRQPEPFDVSEFLRESNGDMESALNSLLRSPSEGSPDADPSIKVDPGPNLSPGLDDSANINAGAKLDPALKVGPDVALEVAPSLRSGVELLSSSPVNLTKLDPDPKLRP